MSVINEDRAARHVGPPPPSPLGKAWQKVTRSSTTGRILFPVVVLVFWLLAIKLVTTIWPFSADVLPTPGRCSASWAMSCVETPWPRTTCT